MAERRQGRRYSTSSADSDLTVRQGDTGNIGRGVAAETEGGPSVSDVIIVFEVGRLSESPDRIRAEEGKEWQERKRDG